MQLEPIAHHVEVKGSVAEVFRGFTAQLGIWWPLAYTYGESNFDDAAVDAQSGDWFERDRDGKRTSWGEIRAYEPDKRVVLAFAIGADRKPVTNDMASEVEVRFAAGTQGFTRVELEHRNFERHGASGGQLRAGLDSPQGWPLILAEFRRFMRTRTT